MTKYFILVIVLLGSLFMLHGSTPSSAEARELPVCTAKPAVQADSTEASEPVQVILVRKLWNI